MEIEKTENLEKVEKSAPSPAKSNSDNEKNY